MDCMDGMKQFPDKYFDLTIVDPPYGIHINNNMGRRKGDKHFPQINGLVAYSSTGEGHEGIVYQADGWFEVSRTANGAKDCRNGRKNIDTSTKIKWCRTP